MMRCLLERCMGRAPDKLRSLFCLFEIVFPLLKRYLSMQIPSTVEFTDRKRIDKSEIGCGGKWMLKSESMREGGLY
jgi:hypothetical protein